MEPQNLDMVRDALMITLMISTPILAAGLLVGRLVSILMFIA